MKISSLQIKVRKNDIEIFEIANLDIFLKKLKIKTDAFENLKKWFCEPNNVNSSTTHEPRNLTIYKYLYCN